jgi:hypothetical protein
MHSDSKPGSMGGSLLRRQNATADSMRKFRSKEHDWKKGDTCVHLARFHLRRMGHSVPKLPPIASMLAAKRALEARGWATVADMLDAQPGLARITPAAMLLGDLAAAPSEDGMGALLVHIGMGRLMGWHDSAIGMVVLDIAPGDLLGAWRI